MEDDRDNEWTEEDARAYGLETERHFFRAFEEPGWERPEWFFSIRKATGIEDSEGIDAVVTTYFGDTLYNVPVQIKSSKEWLLKHEERYGDTRCVIIVPVSYKSWQIRMRTFRLVLSWLRKTPVNQPPLF